MSKSLFYSFKETCTRGHQKRFSCESCYFSFVSQFFVKTVADMHEHMLLITSDKLFSHINIDDFERP